MTAFILWVSPVSFFKRSTYINSILGALIGLAAPPYIGKGPCIYYIGTWSFFGVHYPQNRKPLNPHTLSLVLNLNFTQYLKTHDMVYPNLPEPIVLVKT